MTIQKLEKPYLGGTPGTDQNWTGRTPRTSMTGGAWKENSDKIPLGGWLGAIAVLMLLAVIVKIGAVVGF